MLPADRAAVQFVHHWLKGSPIPKTFRDRVLRRNPQLSEPGLEAELARQKPVRSWPRRLEKLLLRCVDSDAPEIRDQLLRILGPRLFDAWLRLLAAARVAANLEPSYRQLVDEFTDALIVTDPRGRIRFTNRPACALLGYEPKELLRLRIEDTYLPDEAGVLQRRLRELCDGRTLGYERTVLRKDGSRVPVDVRVRRMSDGRLVGLLRDLSERRSADTRFRRIFDSNLIGIAIVRPDGVLASANDAFLRLAGATTEDIRWNRLRWPGDRREGPPREIEFPRSDGARVPVLAGVAAIEGEHAIVFVLDLSEQKRLEADLQHAHQLEAVGRLAAGVAHDFNNVLLVIRGYTDLAHPKAADPVRGHLDKIRAATERANSLVRRLLAFGRKQALDPKVLHLNRVVREMGSVLRRVIGENIEIRSALDPRLGHVRVDPAQLEQVILNLAVNARDAMPGGGILTIETTNDGPDVRLSIRDTGRGMDDSVQRRLFEPYFTTKTDGRGNGLGLALVYGTVKQSGGSIDVESAPGQGSTFHIRFPRIDEVEEPGTRREPRSRSEGSEVLLLVEDDPEVRAVTARFLSERGYEVLEAATGEEALRVAETHEIDLLITDLLLPGMPGNTLARKLEERRPGLRVLYYSGYPGRFCDTDARLLDKSVSPEHLAERVREILDRV